MLINPELDGTSFSWEGGSAGALLLHGLTATTVEVRELGKRLHTLDWTVRAPLLPGHGTHPADLNRTTRHQWREVVETEYQWLRRRCESVVMVGESAGALLALDRALAHPEVEALVLLAPALRLARPWWEQALMFAAAPWIESVPKSPSGKAEHGWQGYSVNPLKAGCELVRLQREVWPQLPRIQQPTLILQGGEDPTVNAEYAFQLQQRISSAIKPIFWFPEAGHVLLLDDVHPHVMNRIDEFLNTLKLSPSPHGNPTRVPEVPTLQAPSLPLHRQ